MVSKDPAFDCPRCQCLPHRAFCCACDQVKQPSWIARREMTSNMASALDSKALAKLDFERHVSTAFRKLVKQGFHPNLAAAYAVLLVSTGAILTFRSINMYSSILLHAAPASSAQCCCVHKRGCNEALAGRVTARGTALRLRSGFAQL